MKALVYTQYGPPDVLQLKAVEKPIPNDDQVLVKIHATTVNRTDNATIKAIPFFLRIVTGLFRPRKQIPGSDFSGVVEAVGRNISSLKTGDRVFGFDDQGAMSHAEYTVITEDKVALMPEGLDFQQAAACCEGFHYAYNCINKIPLKEGNSVLVYGATGAIGSAAVQLLKASDVYVTAVCGTESVERVKQLGADKIYDYKTEDFTQDKQRYDLVFDAVGKASFFKCFHLIKSGGAYTSSDLGFMWQNLFLLLIVPVVRPLLGMRRMVSPVPYNIKKSLLLVKGLVEQGKYQPLIDRTFPFDEIVDAYHYVEKKHKKGNVIIEIRH